MFCFVVDFNNFIFLFLFYYSIVRCYLTRLTDTRYFFFLLIFCLAFSLLFTFICYLLFIIEQKIRIEIYLQSFIILLNTFVFPFDYFSVFFFVFFHFHAPMSWCEGCWGSIQKKMILEHWNHTYYTSESKKVLRLKRCEKWKP